MQKLKNEIIDRMLTASLTDAEIMFLLELSHYQDDTGRIYGVYYKDICETLDIAYQTFYASLRSLDKKGFIRVAKIHREDWNVQIRENDFSYPGAEHEGYVSTGHDIFYDKEFQNLRGNEKLIAMQLLKMYGAGNRSYHSGVAKFYETYSKALCVTKRTIQKYLCSLKKFFSIGIKSGMYWITPLTKVFKNNAPTDRTQFKKNLQKVCCRRNKATYTRETLRDTMSCIDTHMKKAKEFITDIFLTAVEKSILFRNITVKDKREWNRSLNPAFIHKLLIEEIKIQGM